MHDTEKSVQGLNGLGLSNLASNYIAWSKTADDLFDKKCEIEKEIKKAQDTLADMRRRMGEQSKYRGRAIAIHANEGVVCIIPLPAQGYSDPSVYPQFHQLTKIP